MKRIIITLLTSGFLMATPACKKNNITTGSWNATVNNTALSGNFVNATYFSANRQMIVTVTPSVINIYPAITLQGTTDSAGTFNLNGSSSFHATYTDSASAVVYTTASGGVGQFVITAFTPSSSNTVSGTFNFIAHNPYNAGDSVIITNGKFTTNGLYTQ